MQSSTVEEIQVEINEAREVIGLGDDLNRLMQTKEFKAVITEGYFKEEAVRLVELKAAPQMQAVERQAAILGAIDGIGQLQQHFNKIWVMADQAKAAIESSETELAELAVEGEV
jgi:hypothetical protein